MPIIVGTPIPIVVIEPEDDVPAVDAIHTTDYRFSAYRIVTDADGNIVRTFPHQDQPALWSRRGISYATFKVGP